MQHRVVLGFRNGLIAEPLLERVHLGLHREQLVERARRFLEHAATRMFQAILRQVADPQRGRFEDAAGVGLVEPRQHLQQGRLARAIGTAQPDALAIGDLPRDVVKEHAVAKTLGEL